MNKVWFFYVFTFLVFSSKAFSGGGGPISIEDRFNRFENPYLEVRESFDRYLLQSILRETDW